MQAWWRGLKPLPLHTKISRRSERRISSTIAFFSLEIASCNGVSPAKSWKERFQESYLNSNLLMLCGLMWATLSTRVFFFSRVAGILGVGRRHKPRAAKPWEKRAEQYKDVTDTENRTKEVSGAQSIVGLNHSQLKSHFEQRDFKFRGTLWHLTIIWISHIRTARWRISVQMIPQF